MNNLNSTTTNDSKSTETEKLLISLDKVPVDMLENCIRECEKNKNIVIRVKPSELQRLEQFKGKINLKNCNAYFCCNTIAEAQPRVLAKYGIRQVLIGYHENSCVQKMGLIRYAIIRYKLEKLVEDLGNKTNKEKFKEIYIRLANMISYDLDAIEEGTEYAIENKNKSRNLENPVLLGLGVCTGFAETLKQTLSLVGIESKICYSLEDKNGDCHAYNLVKLGNSWYNVDLTWDYINIRRERRPKFCLKSDQEFLNCGEDRVLHIPDEINVPKCYKSIELFPEFKRDKRKKLSVFKNIRLESIPQVALSLPNKFRESLTQSPRVNVSKKGKENGIRDDMSR